MRRTLKTFLHCLLAALLLPCSLAHSGIRITRIQINGSEPGAKPQEISRIIPFTVGEELDEETIKRKMERLSTLAFFTSFHYELIPIGNDPNNILLKIDLAEIPTIRDIFVKDNFPFLDKEIRRLVLMQPGNYFDASLVEKSVGNIVNFLEQRGYYESKVAITTRPHPKYSALDIIVDLDKGKTYGIGKVGILGNQKIPDQKLIAKIKHFGRFQMRRLKNDIKKIRKYYADKGYVKATIKIQEVRFDPKTKKVDIDLLVRENKKLEIRFDGRPKFSQNRLIDVLDYEGQRAYDRFALEEGQNKLREFYRQNGYPDLVITSAMETPDADTVIFTFTIQPGKQAELEQIRFDGHKAFSARKLRKQLLTEESKTFSRRFYNETTLLLDQNRLFEFYQNQGFFDARVGAPQIIRTRRGHFHAVFPITEGRPYIISSLAVLSDQPLDAQEILKKSALKTGRIHTFERITKAKNAVLEYLHKMGYAYAKLEVRKEPNTDKNTVAVTLDINRGKQVRVGSLIIKGNFVTQEKVLRRNLELREGDLYSYQKMLDSQLNLRRLGIFSTVRIEPLGVEQESAAVDLVVTLHERKSVTINTQAGYDSVRSASGEISLIKRNLFGLAKSFTTRLIGGQKFSRAEATFLSPRIFGASWNLANQYFAQYENEPFYNASRYGGSINMLKNYGIRWTVGFKEQVSHFNVYEDQSSFDELGNALFDNTLNEFQTSVSFDARDNFSDPQKGVYVLFRNELNTDLDSLSSNFDIVEFNISHHQGFLNRFTFNHALRYGHTLKINNSPIIPVNKRFFLGGSDTIRGFEEDAINPAGGTIVLIYNAELHFRLLEGLKLAGFLDTGALVNDVNEFNKNAFRESAGLGLRYFTPIGPIRFDWGFPLDRRPGEPNNRFHFSFGFFF